MLSFVDNFAIQIFELLILVYKNPIEAMAYKPLHNSSGM